MKVIKDPLIAAIGGFCCILLLSYLNNFENNYIWLIPSFGASMVLVMSVHKSDLAQPKNIFFGHVISGLSGYFVLSFIGSNIFCIGLGVGLAIFLMMITKTVHPPAGGNPIIVILGEQSLSFIYITLALGSLIIIIFAIIYNKLVGKDYPYKIKKDFN
tara:strand:+ start:50 stop:523 length:474 start_codon:yes stop_codon:yes gene_type:complete